MAVIGVKSITGITSITNAAGGADVLTFHSNNTTERLRIQADGNVALGTNAVSAGDLATGTTIGLPKLHVDCGHQGNGAYHIARFRAGSDNDSNAAVVTVNHSNDRGLAIYGGRSTSNRSWGALQSIDNVGRVTKAIEIIGDEGQGVQDLKFYTGDATTTTERLRIDADGQVLCCSDESFGSTGASGNASMMIRGDDGAWALKLLCRHNQNDYAYLGFASMNGSENLAEIYANRIGTGSANMVFGVRNSGTNIQALSIRSSGDVVVGNFTPIDTRNTGGIHIQNSHGISFRSHSTAASRNWRIRNDDFGWGNLDFSVGTSNSDWADAASEMVLSLTSSRRVGINEVAPEEPLHITHASAPGIQLESTAGGPYKSLIKMGGNDMEIRGSSGQMEFYTGNADGDSSTLRLRITDSGQIRKSQESTVTSLKTYNSNADAFWLSHYELQSSGTYQRYTDVVSIGDGTWGSNMRFFTSTNGSANGLERLRITSNGNVNIGGDLSQDSHKFLVDNGTALFKGKIYVRGSMGFNSTPFGANVTHDTGISVNASGYGGSMLCLCSRNYNAGTGTQAALYFLHFYYDGNNQPAKHYLGGSNDFATFGKSSSNTLTVSMGASNNIFTVIESSV